MGRRIRGEGVCGWGDGRMGEGGRIKREVFV
jgi:hypothetical protein